MNKGEVVELDEATSEMLEKLAKEQGVTADEFLRKLLLEHASKHLKKTASLFLPKMVECHQ